MPSSYRQLSDAHPPKFINHTWVANDSKGEVKLNLKASLNQRKPSRKGVMKVEAEAERALQAYEV